MGKFGIGARVRDDGGDAGEIVDKRKGARLVRYDDTDYGSIWQQKGRLSALPPEVVANDNEVSPCAPVFEKEYSVGDRVRALVDWLDVKAGEEYTVKRLHLEYDGTVQGAWVLEENKGYLTIDEFERSTIAPAPTPTFAKGDRALSQNGDYVTVDTNPDEVDHVWVSFGTTKWRTPVSWLTKWEPKVGDRVNWTRVRGEFDGSTIESHEGLLFDWKLRATNGNWTYAYSLELEPAEPLPVAEQPAAEPAPLVVEAGKFYRTRDGRKVGPIESTPRSHGIDNQYPWTAKVEGDLPPYAPYWRTDGSFSPYKEPSDLDLVAEWVEPVAEDEPEVAAKATFRKGDVMECVNDAGTLWVKVGSQYTALADEDDGFVRIKGDLGRRGGMSTSRFVLAPAEPTITRGTLATLTTPARVAGQFGDKVNLVFPDLPAGRNSFALPASVLAAAA